MKNHQFDCGILHPPSSTRRYPKGRQSARSQSENEEFLRGPCNDCIGWNIVCHNGTTANYGSITDLHACLDQGAMPDPYIMSDFCQLASALLEKGFIIRIPNTVHSAPVGDMMSRRALQGMLGCSDAYISCDIHKAVNDRVLYHRIRLAIGIPAKGTVFNDTVCAYLIIYRKAYLV